MIPKPRNPIWIFILTFSLIGFGCAKTHFTETEISTKPETVAMTNPDHEIRVRAAKEKVIGEVRSTIGLAEAAGAKKIAPLSYTQAVENLDNLDAFISVNPDDEKEIRTMAEDALFEADRLMIITEQGSRFIKMKPEAIALLFEERLHTITEAAGARDMRNQNYPSQLNNIISSVDSLKAERTFYSEKVRVQKAEIETKSAEYQAQIDALNIRVATLEGQSMEDRMAREREAKERFAMEQHLEAEKTFNQRFLTIRSYFQVDEAEVYKQESQLIIRLKTMHFPVGESIISPENYELLGKVQKAINIFADLWVIVEGHTDATGSEDRNMLLSQRRAEAVKAYLVTNRTLLPEAVSAVGCGSERPLASNNTAEGRAINRRIDVLIIPETRSM